MEYATALFEAKTVERYLGYFRTLLEGMVAGGEGQAVDDIVDVAGDIASLSGLDQPASQFVGEPAAERCPRQSASGSVRVFGQPRIAPSPRRR